MGCRLAGRHLLCSGVTRTSFSRFVACRSLFVASAWAVNDSLRSNMSPACRRIARHALCGCVTQPFRFQRRITSAVAFHSRSNLLKTALYERELLLAANEEKERRKLVQTRAESKFICIMPSAAEVAQSECLSVGKQRRKVCTSSELPRSRICRVKTTTAKTKRPCTQSFV